MTGAAIEFWATTMLTESPSTVGWNGITSIFEIGLGRTRTKVRPSSSKTFTQTWTGGWQMKSKVMKIGILSWEGYQARNLAIARGHLKPKPTDPKIWMPSLETAAKVLSDDNIALLRTIKEQKPQSVTELATLMNRKQGNVSRTLKTMSRYGIAELRETASRSKRPVALATEFQVELREHCAVDAQQNVAADV